MPGHAIADAIGIENGPFAKRAAKVVSNASLYDLVEDVARAVDNLSDRMDRILLLLGAMQEKIDARS